MNKILANQLHQMLMVVEFGSSPFDVGMGHEESDDELSLVFYEAVQQCGDKKELGGYVLSDVLRFSTFVHSFTLLNDC